ncbi:MAG TPA: hypothetical protein VGM92_00755 [Candidatus Kapabacteria bacterium]
MSRPKSSRLKSIFALPVFALPIFAVPVLLLLISCGTDYPVVPQNISFNVDRTFTFSVPAVVTINRDTTLVSTVATDTEAYDSNGTTTSQLQTARVWSLTLVSDDENYTLDKLGTVTVLIGGDTVAFDPMPAGTIDTTLTLTQKDITKPMQSSTFTASLVCHPSMAPPNAATITCAMTVIYSAYYPI